ncbi:hemagglutinin repeat-containing protein [Paraburkholderia sp. CNPSo 3272]|uniref:two-partner secretion domain-containing protein n=1 Tax=Paraburkholderia sp. CNPSo 3272 TaxID=2940931 RepID=UPI0020B8E854|nr:hemagglutinin repeat-containing protein [Paraburkholderia sp. CNPSo 3272]MCP3726472.1 hemagglutinin repeat-containing protein [Paraburkholderia sp. CNPSo 3272]
MNDRCYRLVFSKLRGMLVAVSETATGHSSACHEETGPARALQSFTLFSMRHAAFAALVLFALPPALSEAQVVPSGPHAPNVITTANGLPQVNVTKPSGAGVSLNTYSQFDVQKNGTILNNSPVITGTQLAGQISGNPNFGPNDAAKIIVNQVNSNNPSQLRGYVEVAGTKADAVISNSSGIVVDGGGFINTARGILTTGNPLIDGSGNLTGFSVRGGLITVQGAGLNASNIDEVDLLSRALEVNAAIYGGNTLHVVTGANNIDYTSLVPTPIAGTGPAPGVAIDVSQLGGMYSNRIVLVGTENGVGVANAGAIAAQAGDLILTSAGQLVQSGKVNASANVGIRATGVANTGTIYAQGNTAIGTAGTVSNSGTLAAQQSTSITAGNIASTGTLGASVNGDGSVGSSGDLLLSASGQLDATGLNLAGGNATLTGSGVNLVGSETAANRNLSLAAYGGDVNLAGATTSAGGAVNAQATGALVNDSGSLSAGSGITLDTGSISNHQGEMSSQGAFVAQTSGQMANQGGQFVSQGAMQVSSGGAIANNAGVMQGAAGVSVAGSSLDNTAGRITSLSSDGLSVTTTGQLLNAAGSMAGGAQGGVIGGNGAVTLQGGGIVNHGAVSAQTDLQVDTQSLNNDAGVLQAQNNATINAGAQLTDNGGAIVAGQAARLSARTLDNSGGVTQAALLALNATNLVNHAGTITQSGSGPMSVNVSNTLDNSAGGTLQTNSTDLSLASAAIENDGGTITHAGTGTLTLDAGNGRGTLSNVNGKIQSNGEVVAQASAFNNTQGQVVGQNGLTAAVGGALNNTNGKLLSNADLSLTSGTLNNNDGQAGAGANETIHAGSVTNSGGVFVAPNLSITTGGTFDNSGGETQANQLALSATDLLNHGGTITQFGASPMALDVSDTLDNSANGVIQTNSTDLTLAPASLINDNGGTITHAGTGTLTIDPGNGSGSFSNAGGQVLTAGQLHVKAGSVNNQAGALAAQGAISATVAGGVNNNQGVVRSLSSIDLASGGALTNVNGQIQSGTGSSGDTSTLGVQAASIDSTNGLISNLGTGDTTVQGGSQIVNSNGLIAGNGAVRLNASFISNTQNGQVAGAAVSIQTGTLDDTAGKIGTFTGSGGDVDITATGAVSNTNGQIGADHDLLISAATLTGGGAYSAANDVTANLLGDFAPTSAMQFTAGHDLTFTLPGTFTNSATLEAVNNLGINANDINNSGAMMAGGTLSTHSNTLENSGAIVGSSVSLNATTRISNVGPTALIGATNSNGLLELLAPDIENRDDTTATDTQATTAIFGLGRVVLAGGKGASGNYTNANLIDNVSALIQSSADMAMYSNQVTNTRRVMTTDGAYTEAVDPSIIEQLGISLSGCTAAYIAACGPGNPQVMGIRFDPNASDYDPAVIAALQAGPGGMPIDPPHGGQWNSTYQYTTYTGVALGNLITAISPKAQIMAGGNLDLSNVGLFQNYWSAVAAVGNIAMPAYLDANSWAGQLAPGVQVTYSGQYHYDNYDNSEHNWQLPFGNATFVTSNPGGYQVAPASIKLYSLPDYESTWGAGGTISGNGVSINNTAGNAGIPSLGLVNGQSISGVNVGSVSGSANGTKSGAASIQGNATQVDPVIAHATAVSVLSNLSVPQGGLFNRDTAPNAPYLIESNPAFTSAKSFISSDYYLQQLGLNPQTVEKRLGDGLYEQQLLQNQITSLTGKAVLGPYTDTQSMYQALLAAGASLSESLNLPLGMALSPAQVAALTTNVVIMQTEMVDGQSVLVPVVYLAQASQQNMNGPLITATDIDLQNAQTFTNSGTMQASNSLTINGKSIDNAFGTLQSGGLMSLATSGDVNFTSATVNAGSLALNAGGNLLLNTATNTVNQVSATGATRTTTMLGPIANLNVKGDAAIVTGGNFEQNGANLNVGGNLGMAVGGNYDIGTVQTGEQKVVHGANGVSDTNINSATGSSVKVGGVSLIGVGGDLTATGANINLGGGGTIAANGNVTLQAATTTSTIDSSHATSDHNGNYSDAEHLSSQALTSTTLTSGNTLNVVSGNNINVSGSSIVLTQGNANLQAANDVNIGGTTATQVSDTQQTSSTSHIVSSKQVASTRDTTTTQTLGSTISADGVSISSGHDINVAGSTIVGTNDVALSAAHDLTVTTTQDTMQSSGTYQEQHSGLGTSGLTVTAGTSKLTQTDQESSVTNNGSLIGSLDGNVSMTAGNNLHITSSDVIAAQNVTGKAANVTIDSATNTSNYSETTQTRKSGFTLGLSGSVGDAINGAYQQGQAVASGNSDSRATALHAIAAAGDAAIAGAGATGGALAGQSPSIGVQLSFGSSQSSSTFSESQAAQQGSTVQAGGTASFTATGNGTPGSGNVTIAGSNVSANDVALTAKNAVNIVNTTNTDQTASTNKSSSANVGVSYGTQGFGVSASMSNAHGDANSDAAIQNNSHITGANSVTITSGGDTNIVGSDVAGGTVTANVGGNLNIRSVQDTTVSTAHQSSTGGGFSISQGGGSASFSAQNGHADSNFAQVTEQAGIEAGSGGFNVNVNGNTNLTGAVISSTADPSKNSLTTGTLTFSDIQNQSHYDATSNGISAGVGVGSTGKAIGPGSVGGTGGVSPMMSQNESGDSSATTRSAISAGSINITNRAAQTQDVSTLSRDTTNTNGTVAQTPDVNAILNQQADTMQAAQAAGQVVAQGIGAYADSQRQAAVDQAKIDAANGDTAAFAADAATAKQWDEGGESRAILQAAGGALIGGLGGGSVFTAVGGAAGAGIASTMANQLDSLSKGVASETGSSLLGNLAANVAAGAGGALVGGGTAGAATATNVDLYNRQLDPKEKSLAQQLADASGGRYTVAQIEDQMRQMEMSVNGTTTSGAPATLVGRTPTDSGAKWMSAGTTANGQPVLTQILAPSDPALQSYILANYNSVSPGQVPSQFTYPSSGGGGSINVTGPFTNFDHSDVNYMRSTTADAASMISTTAGRFGSATAAAASIPSPYTPLLDSATFGATVVGMAADGVSQLVQPNVGQYWQSGLTSVVSDRVSAINPIATPVVNEAANAFNASGIATSIQDSINSFWGGLVNSVKK